MQLPTGRSGSNKGGCSPIESLLSPFKPLHSYVCWCRGLQLAAEHAKPVSMHSVTMVLNELHRLLQADCVRLMSKSALVEPGGVLAQVQPNRHQVGQRVSILCVLLVCILRNTEFISILP